ncbi:MAG: class I SAM-dependent methyltransferase [Alphaproteobacteria bacterium]|nr:class I SAM-dependent methyltransferase [Alphaproteobacteria bacterium]
MSAINDILFWVCGFVLCWQAYILIFNRGIPNIRTAPAVRDEMIRLLRGAGAKRIYDLGAGVGDLSRAIAKTLPEARVTGIEISKSACRKAETRARRAGFDNLDYKQADFMKTDLSDADGVVMFLLDTMMPCCGKNCGRS